MMMIILALFLALSQTGQANDCLQPSGVTGPCRASFPRWTYSSAEGTCSMFTYGGCQGNANNFLTQLDCLAKCQGRSGGGGAGVGGGVVRGERERVSCNSPPFQFGDCSFSLQRWSYVWQTNTCQPFLYSGCDTGGTVNRFATRGHCTRSCLV